LLLDRAPNAVRTSPRNTHAAVALLVFTTVVLHAEVAGLLVPLVLQALIGGWTSVRALFVVGLLSGLGSLGSPLPSRHPRSLA
jgi:alpha-1,6-mannosyltransferase